MESVNTDKYKKSQQKLSQIKAPLFKIVLAGDSEVGKTTLIKTFLVS
jgi:GTPase SAR1 family protein